jgi:hypothetical protein
LIGCGNLTRATEVVVETKEVAYTAPDAYFEYPDIPYNQPVVTRDEAVTRDPVWYMDSAYVRMMLDRVKLWGKSKSGTLSAADKDKLDRVNRWFEDHSGERPSVE